MPDVSYEIIIREVSGGNGTGSGASSGNGSSAPSNSGGSGKGTPSDTGWLNDIYGAYKAIAGFAPIAGAASVAINYFQWQIGLVGRDTGNTLTQERINYSMRLAGEVVSSAGMFALGVATANPLLMIAGFVSGANTAINYSKERDEFYYNRTWEYRALNYARERAGMSYNRSRTE